MKIDLFAFVTAYWKGLATAANILEKGAEHARATGASEAEMLDWRLAPDMWPLSRQIQVVINFAQQWPSKAAGLAEPATLDGPTTVAELKDRIAAAQAYLTSLKPEQFAGRDEVPLTMNLGQIEPTMPTGQWIMGFATTNFYFHLNMAYAILRSRGAPLGKLDLFAGGL